MRPCSPWSFCPASSTSVRTPASECIQLISQGERPAVRSAMVYYLEGDLADEDVGGREALRHQPGGGPRGLARAARHPGRWTIESPADVEVARGLHRLGPTTSWPRFIDELRPGHGSGRHPVLPAPTSHEEGRDPTITEITHDRHLLVRPLPPHHLRHRARRRGNRRRRRAGRLRALSGSCATSSAATRSPVCLMDMGTIGAKWLKKEGILTGLDESEEINACTVQVQGGRGRRGAGLAATCSRTRPTTTPPRSSPSAARPPAWAAPSATRSRAAPTCTRPCASPARPTRTVPVAETHARQAAPAQARHHGGGRLLAPTATRSAWPRARCTSCTTPATPPSAWRSARWWARRRPTTCVARRRRRATWSCCWAAAPAATASAAPPAPPRPTPWNRWRPAAPRCRRATRPVERKIQRLFRRGDACRMIKRCNDFGAGGVSVAIGELADGLDIDLDAVPKKYDGLDGTELAISEIAGAHGRGAGAPRTWTPSSRSRTRRTWRPRRWPQVTEEPRVRMQLERRHHRGREPRVPRHSQRRGRSTRGREASPKRCDAPSRRQQLTDRGGTLCGRALERRWCSDLNVCLEQGPCGALRLHHRRGHGAHALRRRAPAHPGAWPWWRSCRCSSARPPTVSRHGLGLQPVPRRSEPLSRARTWPWWRSWPSWWPPASSWHNVYLTFQEYFEKLRDEPERWGKPAGGRAGRADGADRPGRGRHRRQGLHVRHLRAAGRAADAGVLRDGHRQSIDRVTSPELKEAGDNLIWRFASRMRVASSAAGAAFDAGGAPHRRRVSCAGRARRRRLRRRGRDAVEDGRGQRHRV